MNKNTGILLSIIVLLIFIIGFFVVSSDDNELKVDACYIDLVGKKGISGYYKVLKELDHSYIMLPTRAYSKVDQPTLKDQWHGKIPGIYSKDEVLNFTRIDCLEGDVAKIYMELVNKELTKGK